MLDLPRYLNLIGEKVRTHRLLDTTGDGSRDVVITADGIGCASCHAQGVFIVHHGLLIFGEQNSDVLSITSQQGALTIKAGRDVDGYQTESWRWSSNGFTSALSCVVPRSTDLAFNDTALPSAAFPWRMGAMSQSALPVALRPAHAEDSTAVIWSNRTGLAGGCVQQENLSGGRFVRVETLLFDGPAHAKDAFMGSDAPHPWIASYSEHEHTPGVEVISFIDDTTSPVRRGAWELVTLQSGEVLITVQLHGSGVDRDARDQLQAVYVALEVYLQHHLTDLMLDYT